ncbi:uncharacterized protein [Solanum lycopersicum]|uniref:uncharacterized protein isoform X2 n=1 Tax=Solanum lycopersicum TaxID=4081 RepID=UPI000532C442
MLGRVSSLVTILIFAQTGILYSHHEAAHWSCDSNADTHVQAHFNPGRITLDGQVDDWKDMDGSAFSVLPALDPDADKAYNGGKMTVKASHDGKDVFFMLQVDGDYTYSEGYSNKTASVALMFQIGENASYHRMGGCEEEPDTCTSKSCKGHEVDLMHFSIGKAIPGRLYGGNLLDNSEGNGGDRFGHLVDLYCWNPHCRYLDGYGPSGFIKDDSPYSSSNQSGAYYFEFSRPLRTMDRLQQDAQFTIGKTSKMSVAFWYPENGKPWHGSGHFSISCDWILLDILADSSELTKVPQRSSWDAATAFSLLFSVVAFCISIFVGHRVSRTKNIPFTPMSNL